MNGEMNNETSAFRSNGNHVNNFDQVMYANGRQNFDFEQNVRQFLNEYCVNYLKFIIQEMQFYLNMLTYKATKKHLFTRQNRGDQKMQGIIDISYREISKFTLQIIIPLTKLSSRERDMVLEWLYDECDKLCAQFHSKPLSRAELFFENLIQHCAGELKERQATQSDSKRKKISNLPNAYQTNHQQMSSNDFAVPPPPYTSPNNPIGKLTQNTYQPYRQQQQFPTSNFVAPNGLRQYCDVQAVAQASPFSPRSQQMNTTQAQYMQRPMTAPIHTSSTETLSNVNRNSHGQYTEANSNATRNQWAAQSANHFQHLIPSQNVTTSRLKTMLTSPQQPMHMPLSQQGTASNQIYEIANSNNGNQLLNGTIVYGMNENLSFQQVLFAPTLNDQQATHNVTGFEVMPIQRQSIEDSSAASNNTRNSLQRDASTYRNESSATNFLSQSNQPQQQITMTYDECIADGTKTPTLNIRLQMDDLLNFNPPNTTNNEIINQRSNELSTPNMQTNYYQSERIDEIVNDELRLSDSVEPLEFEYEITSNVGEVIETCTEPTENQVIIENSNSERVDAEVAQSLVDGGIEPLPSMPELSVDPMPEKSPSPEPNPPLLPPGMPDEPNADILVPGSPDESLTSKSREKTSTETAGISSIATCTPNSVANNSDAPCTSKSILNQPPVTTNEYTIAEGAHSSESQTEDDNDCEMILVKTQTHFTPFMKKEEPNVSTDDHESGNHYSFDDVPSTSRKCKRYVDLTEEDDDCDSDVVVLDSDEEGVIELKFVSTLTAKKFFAQVHCPSPTNIIDVQFRHFRFP